MWGNENTQILIAQGNGLTGLFVYNGFGALGNPPIASITNSSHDPFGNAVVPGIASYDAFGDTGQLAAAALNFFAGVIQTVKLDHTGLTFDTTGAQLNFNDPSYTFAGFINSGAGVINIQSPRTAGLPIQAVLNLGSGATANAAGVVIQHNLLIFGSSGVPVGFSSGPLLFNSSATGMLRFVADGTHGDGNPYDTGRAVFTASGQLVNSLVAANVTGITGITVAAITYLIRGMIIVSQGGTTANQAIQVTGPAVSSMNIGWRCIEASSVLSSGVQTALNANLTTGSVPSGTTGELYFEGEITFSATGSTFGLTALCVTAAADTWTLSAGSYMVMEPVG